MQSIGIFGGTFDPIHFGHLRMAEELRVQLGLEQVRFLPSARPPHRDHTHTSTEHRMAMARLAIADNPAFVLDTLELERDGPSYTVDTARWAEQEWGDVVFLVGADEFADFHAWKDPDQILEHVRLGVATRPGYPHEELDAVLARLRRPERVELFEIPAVDVSSTEIRRRAAHGEPIDALVPPGVARLVVEDGLYDELP